MTHAKSPSPRAAAVALLRLPGGQVLVGTRTLKARSFPGFLAFPGGVCDAGDEDLPRLSARLNGTTTNARERGCALRELGEETGRWLLATPAAAVPTAAALRTFVQTLAERDLAAALEHSQLVLDDRRLIALGRFVTPTFLPHRFSVRQFLLELPQDPGEVTAPTDELSGLRYASPSEIRREWNAGEALLLPPIAHVVKALAAHPNDNAALLHALRDVPDPEAPELRDLIEGIAVEPYKTATLPPAEHTNCVLLGAADFYVVDPATCEAQERSQFDALLTELARQGRRPLGIVLTHHHPDHVGDVERVAAQYELKVFAHPETSRLLPGMVDVFLNDGDTLQCPAAPERPESERLFEVLHTPGHAKGHLCFLERRTQTLIAGDMVAAIGSILIAPGEGHMGTYLDSLERLIGLQRPGGTPAVRRLIAAHGPLLADGHSKLRDQLAHRQARQAQVLAALGDTPQQAEDLVEAIYGQDTPKAAWPLATLSLQSALQLLVERQQAKTSEAGFTRASSPAA